LPIRHSFRRTLDDRADDRHRDIDSSLGKADED